MKLTLPLLLAFAALRSAVAQDLPPGAVLLARIKSHTRAELARLPNCSCLESVRREYRPSGGKLRPLDTIRLEVLYSNHHEFYASPGDRAFNEEHPSAFAGSGTIGNGHFALFLSEIAGEGLVTYQYKGEEPLRGHLLARYDYRVPVSMSGHTMTFTEGRGTVGMKGSFWADPATFDILRIEMEAEDIPPQLPVELSTTAIDYSHTNLGGADFLVPQAAETRLVKFSGEESINHIEFTHCHLYGAESSISFGPSSGPATFGASSVLEVKRELLPALQIVVKVATPVTQQTPVGKLIEGAVVGNVVRKGNVIIPDGSPVRGRVRRLEWNPDKGGYFVVALEFTDIEVGGARYRFFADLQETDPLPGLHQTLRIDKREPRAVADGNPAYVESTEILSLPEIPGVGSFFVQSPNLELPAGFRMTWKTRALVP